MKSSSARGVGAHDQRDLRASRVVRPPEGPATNPLLDRFGVEERLDIRAEDMRRRGPQRKILGVPHHQGGARQLARRSARNDCIVNGCSRGA